tara:strand:+ start:4441 stop:4776 length:336 start_codon:yes stop_codon:yes gene_type:complete
MTITHQKIEGFIASISEREFNPQVTKSQILAGGRLLVACWGTEYFRGVGEKGLYLKVNGYRHKGYVVIILGFMDTYSIHLLDLQGNQTGEFKHDIYCDQLTDVIDSLVETV